MDIDRLSRTLSACLQADLEAEVALDEAAKNPGFGSSLLQLSLQPSATKAEDGVKQLALVVLKKYVKEHWHESSRRFQEPVTSEQEKASIRQHVLQGLSSPSSKVRVAVGMVVAAIAEFDFPLHWPGLLEALVTAIQNRSNNDQVHGALRCLDMLSHDIEEWQLMQVVPVLMPELLNIVGSGGYDTAMQHRALSILRGLLVQLGVLSGAYQRQVRDLMVPQLMPWCPVLAAILNAPLTTAPSCWALKQEALQVVVQLVSFFAKPMHAQVSTLLAPCWAMFIGGVPMYENLLVDPEDAGEQAEVDDDEDPLEIEGESTGLEAMFAQMFELLLAVVGSPRLNKSIQPVIPQMAYTCVAYMQMTAAQVESWASNANAYVADEEDETFTARVSGELLLEELATSLGGVRVVMELFSAVERRFMETAQVLYLQPEPHSPHAAPNQDADSSPECRRAVLMREAAMVALGVLSPHILRLTSSRGKGGGGSKRGRPEGGPADACTLQARAEAILACMLKHDLQRALKSPFLAGRALWAASKLSSLLAPAQADALLQAACEGIHSNLPPPVRIGSCRALVTLMPSIGRHAAAVAAAATQGAQLDGTQAPAVGGIGGGTDAAAAAAAKLAPFLPHLYAGLVLLLAECCDETLHLVLETLAAVLRLDANGAVVLQYLPQVASPVLDVWAKNVADPLISDYALAVLSVIAQQPPCLQPLAQQLLPTLVQVVAHPHAQSSTMLEGCLQMLHLLVLTPKHITPEAAAAAAVLSGLCPIAPPPAPTDPPEQQQAQHELRQQQMRQVQQQVQQQQQRQQMAVAEQVHVSVLQPLLGLLASSDDPGVQQSAQKLLCQLVRTGRAEVLGWGAADPTATLHALVQAARHLLQPGMDEACGALAGDLVFEMLTAFPQQVMAPYLPELLHLVVARLVSVNMSPLVCGLLLVLARLAHADHNALINTLAAMMVPLPGGQATCALDAALGVWLERCGELQGRYRLTLAVTALGLLLECNHPRLGQVMVKGRRADLGQQGVRTRAQVHAAGGEKFTTVPAPLKILALMADLLADVQELGDCIRGAELDTYDESDDEGDNLEAESGSEAELEEGSVADDEEDANEAAAMQAEDKLLMETIHGGLRGAGAQPEAAMLLEATNKDDKDAAAGAVPGEDPTSRLRLSTWLPELFVRLSLSPLGQQLLQAAGAHAMTPRQTAAARAPIAASGLSHGPTLSLQAQ